MIFNIKQCNKLVISLLISIIIFILVLFFIGTQYFIPIAITIAAIFMYFIFAKEDLFNPVATYTLFWLGGIGISNLKLSYDQKDWSSYVWVNMILAYVMFLVGYYYVKKKSYLNMTKKINKYKYSNERLYFSIIMLATIIFTAFLIEIIILKFIPLFSSEMDAYKRFHISGLHYFVVTSGIMPSLTMIYKKNGGTKKIFFINIFSLAIPILIVSRQLLLLEVILVIITYNYLYKRISKKVILVIASICIIAFSVASNLRHQNLSYIYEVSNMKTTGLSFFLQPYLYVAMSFENLRNIIANFHSYKLGINILFPVFAFTNTKNFFDSSYKLDYLTNKYFTVSTYLSDIYYDFGIFGVVGIVFLLGCIYSYVYNVLHMKKEPNIIITIHGILIYCIIFSFFDTWFFNPTIWFYMIILMLIVAFCNLDDQSIVNKIMRKFKIKLI